MRISAVLFSWFFVLSFVVGGIATAQTMPNASTPAKVSKAALRKQDRQECTEQANQQNIDRRNQAEFVRQCMADRQGARRAAR